MWRLCPERRQAIPAGNSLGRVYSWSTYNRIGDSCTPVGVIPRRGFSFARKSGKPDLDRIPGYIRAFRPNSASRKVDRFADQLFAEMFESRQGIPNLNPKGGEIKKITCDKASKDAVAQAIRFLLRWMPEYRLKSAFKERVAVITDPHSRPMWCPRKRLIRTDGTVESTLHEFGHVIEEGLGLGKFTNDWLLARSRGMVKLSHVDPRYSKDEIAFDGYFYDPYIGKYYPDGSGTEVISMGVELLYTEEREFIEADFNHYALVVGVLSGRLP